MDGALRIDADRDADFPELRRIAVLGEIISDELECLLFLRGQHAGNPSHFILSECRQKNEKLQATLPTEPARSSRKSQSDYPGSREPGIPPGPGQPYDLTKVRPS